MKKIFTKQNRRILIYTIITAVAVLGALFTLTYLKESNARLEAGAFQSSYNYWFINVRIKPEIENSETIGEDIDAFLSFICMRDRIDKTKFNFMVLEDKVVIIYLADNDLYTSIEIGVSGKLLNEFLVANVTSKIEKMLNAYGETKTSLYYLLDENNLPIQTKFTVTYIYQEDELFQTECLYGHPVKQFPQFQPESFNSGENPSAIEYVYYSQGATPYDLSAPILGNTTIVVTENLAYGVAYNGYRVFTTLEEALVESPKGSTIVLMSDYSCVDLVIPKGITLLIPALEDKLFLQIDGDNSHSRRYVSDMAFITLQVDNLVVEGGLLVSGIIGVPQSSGYYQGHTSGAYGEIIVNRTIVVNGRLDTCGYITGIGEMTVNGTVFSPFVVKDYRGGTNTMGVALAMIAPFSVYEMPNIQIKTIVNSQGIYGCNASLVTYNQYNKAQSPIVGPGGMIVLDEGSTATLKYDAPSAHTTITIKGGGVDGSFSLQVIGLEVSLAGYFFPVHYGMTVIFEDGDYVLSQSYKLLTGSHVIIKEDANVTVKDPIAVYEIFNDVNFGSAQYPVKAPAVLEVFGILIIDSDFGGKIQAQVGSVITLTENAKKITTSREGINSADGGLSIHLEYVQLLEIIGPDGSVEIAPGQTVRIE